MYTRARSTRVEPTWLSASAAWSAAVAEHPLLAHPWLEEALALAGQHDAGRAAAARHTGRVQCNVTPCGISWLPPVCKGINLPRHDCSRPTGTSWSVPAPVVPIQDVPDPGVGSVCVAQLGLTR